MHRLISKHECPYGIFTKTIPRHSGSNRYRQGINFEKTKNESAEIVAQLISNDIVKAIQDGVLPELEAVVTVSRRRPIPKITVKIEKCNKQIVEREVSQEYDCSRFLEFYEPCLKDPGYRVWARIAQIVWSYNADLPGGTTKFLYSIKLSNFEMVRQLENFDQAYVASLFKKNFRELSPEIYE